jgi:uncharacterized protein YkwD
MSCRASAAAPPPPRPTPPGLQELEAEVDRLVNDHRRRLGLPPLVIDGRLAGIAREFSRLLARPGRPLEHAGFDERTRAVRQHFPAATVAENLARNNFGRGETARRALESWLRSPAHRSTLEGPFDVTGVGVAVSPDGTFQYTQLFVRRAR